MSAGFGMTKEGIDDINKIGVAAIFDFFRRPDLVTETDILQEMARLGKGIDMVSILVPVEKMYTCEQDAEIISFVEISIILMESAFDATIC